MAENGEEVKHKTVKPLGLMRYLVRAYCPAGGTVLDPFLGSESTAVAAVLEGMLFIGCELTIQHLPIIDARITAAEQLAAVPSVKKVNPVVPVTVDGAEQLNLFG